MSFRVHFGFFISPFFHFGVDNGYSHFPTFKSTRCNVLCANPFLAQSWLVFPLIDVTTTYRGSWCQIQATLTACYVRCLIALWDNRSIGQL